MAGIAVTRTDLDWKAAQAVLAIREGFKNAAVVKAFLDEHPSNAEGGDHLTNPDGFGYTADEAYLLRLVFDQFDALNVEPVLEIGQKLTGLE